MMMTPNFNLCEYHRAGFLACPLTPHVLTSHATQPHMHNKTGHYLLKKASVLIVLLCALPRESTPRVHTT